MPSSSCYFQRSTINATTRHLIYFFLSLAIHYRVLMPLREYEANPLGASRKSFSYLLGSQTRLKWRAQWADLRSNGQKMFRGENRSRSKSEWKKSAKRGRTGWIFGRPGGRASKISSKYLALQSAAISIFTGNKYKNTVNYTWNTVKYGKITLKPSIYG